MARGQGRISFAKFPRWNEEMDERPARRNHETGWQNGATRVLPHRGVLSFWSQEPEPLPNEAARMHQAARLAEIPKRVDQSAMRNARAAALSLERVQSTISPLLM